MNQGSWKSDPLWVVQQVSWRHLFGTRTRKRSRYIVSIHGKGAEKNTLTIDLSRMYETFSENLRFFIGSEIVIPMQGRSDNQAFLDRFEDGSLDAVCVDGAHTYDEVCDDIKNWWPKLKPDGVMIGDDYNWKSVNQAVNDTFKEMKIDNQIWMNSATEYTWYVAKNGNAEPYKKAIPK